MYVDYQAVEGEPPCRDGVFILKKSRDIIEVYGFLETLGWTWNFPNMRLTNLNHSLIYLRPGCSMEDELKLKINEEIFHSGDDLMDYINSIRKITANCSTIEGDRKLIQILSKQSVSLDGNSGNHRNYFEKPNSPYSCTNISPAYVNTEVRLKKLIQARNSDVSDKDKEAFCNALMGSPLQDLVIEKFKISMTYEKLQVLKPEGWINGEVVNFYMSMLQERDSKQCASAEGGRHMSHYFNSFFMTKLLERDQYTYANVQRWSKTIDVFSMDKIFIPVNISNNHWTMAVIFVVKKEMHYYDSQSGSGMKYLLALQQWFKDEAKDKKSVEDLDTSDWKLLDREQEVPQQANGYDCGVFSIMCADFLSDDLPIDSYSQSEMPAFRVKIGCSILRGSIPY